jgi:hypothetical protein
LEGELVILTMMAAVQEAGTVKEAVEYAAREAAAPGLKGFAGGDSIAIGGVLVLVLVIVLIWWLFTDHGHH